MDLRRLSTIVLLALGILIAWVVLRRTWLVWAGFGALMLYLLQRSRSDTPDAEPREVEDAGAPPEPSLPEWIEHLHSLAVLNASIREHGLPEAVTAKLEETIDALRRVLPELNAGYLGSELSWTVNRMASDYLPRIVRPYLALSPGARAQNEAELLESLQGLERELANIEAMLRDHQEGEFKTKAAFLRARFLDDRTTPPTRAGEEAGEEEGERA